MTETADRYRRLASRFTEVVDSVQENRWDRRSPCPDWSALDVLAHIVDTQRGFLDRGDFAPEPLDDDPRRAWPQIRAATQDVLDDPDKAATSYESAFGPMTLEQTFADFGLPELLVHGWDIARATGLSELEPMPDDEMRTSFTQMRALGDAIRQPGAFGPEVEVAEDADEQSKFLAFLGRNP